jgi:hypothetical protein
MASIFNPNSLSEDKSQDGAVLSGEGDALSVVEKVEREDLSGVTQDAPQRLNDGDSLLDEAAEGVSGGHVTAWTLRAEAKRGNLRTFKGGLYTRPSALREMAQRLSVTPSPNDHPNDPNTVSLYRHFDARGRLLYVGISNSVLLRLKSHKGGSHWYRDIARVQIKHFRTRRQAERAEALAIATENPLHNTLRPKVAA